jgi:hypothetical protein
VSQPAFAYETSGRNWATLITVLVIWGVVAALVVWIEMSVVLAGIVLMVTLPALYDLITARAAGLTINDTTLSWHAGVKTGEINVKKIKHIRFDTRLDMSVRLTAVMHVGQKVKIPFEATPPHRAFEAELESRGIKTERHHFGFI